MISKDASQSQTISKMYGTDNATTSNRGGNSSKTVTITKSKKHTGITVMRFAMEIFLLNFVHISLELTQSIQRGGGRFTEQLLKKGLITPEMLNKLHMEWNQKGDNSAATTDDKRVVKKEKKGSRRKK